MINLVIKAKDNESMLKIREEFHKALVDSPAYINSEIAICTENPDNSNEFNLVIGDCNNNDITKVIEVENIKDLIE